MNYTTNYGLKKPESTDRFLVGTLNDNADTIDSLFGGIRIAVKTRAEYDAMVSHDPNTLYLVNDGGEFALFFGDAAQAGGAIPGNTLLNTVISAPSSVGTVTIEEG